MLKKLVVNVLEKLLKGLKADRQKSVADYCKDRTKDTIVKVSFGDNKRAAIDLSKTPTIMQERILEQDEINEEIESIQVELISKGYKALPDILDQYPDCVLAAYVVKQKVALGEYSPEKDNIDSYTRLNLIDMAAQLNQQAFRMRMTASGKATVTDKQLNAIHTLCDQLAITVAEPKDRFEASDIIDELSKKVPHKTSSMIGQITEAQYRRLHWLCQKLGYETPICASIKAGSEMIQKFQAELDLHPELTNEPCTKEQVEYVKRLLKQLNKRWSEKRETEYSAMTKIQISSVIKELQTQIPEEQVASEGQVRYIVDLCRRLDKPCNIEDVKKLTKQEATKTIDSLRRDYLFIFAKANGTMLSKESIKAMTASAVKEMLDQITLERKTKFYTVDSDEVDSIHPTK